jgi:peptidoglycan lytic transglycosylase
MRPTTLTLRARRAALALAALSTTAAAALPAAMAQTDNAHAQAPQAPVPTTAATATAASVPVAPRISVRARRLDVVAGSRAHVRGRVIPAQAGQRVALQRRSGGRWRAVDGATTDARGRFAIAFRPQRLGSARVRVRTGGGHRGVGRLNVYRHAVVSWYGPGLYGNPLGCGGTLTPGTLGVANKTLPCGTKLTLRHGSRHVRVRVVDRGPYVGGREFDLTSATRERLGFAGVGTVLVTR